MRKTSGFAIAALCWAVISPATGQLPIVRKLAAEWEFNVVGTAGHETQVVASNDPLIAASNYKIWIPDNTPVVKVIFAVNLRAAGQRLFFKDLKWRAMAERNDAAILFCEFEALTVRNNGYGLSMVTACDQFATGLGRPELENAPFVLWGHSMGGRVSQDFTRYLPSRVLAFHIGMRRNPTNAADMVEEPAAKAVPGLYMMGEEDNKPADIRQHFVDARTAGSARAWIWVPGQDHWPVGMSFDTDGINIVDNTLLADWEAWVGNEFLIPWTEAMIQLRIPPSADPSTGPVPLLAIDETLGWLGNIDTGQIAPYNTFSGSKEQASWFPNESVAKTWVEFAFP